MSKKKSILPSLSSLSNPISNHLKDKRNIEKMLKQNQKNNSDYRFQQQFSMIKASNFLSRIDNLDDPSIIFTVTQKIQQNVRNKPNKQNIDFKTQKNFYKQAEKKFEIRSPKPSFSSTNSKNNSFSKKYISQDRSQAVNLAKWIENKLFSFKNKTSITLHDILEYKQTILNFGLGKIIDSLSKKCKEEGQLLSFIWNSTFQLFESVFNILVNLNSEKDKDNQKEQFLSNKIFETNLNFLRKQNEVIKNQNDFVYEKMNKVIQYNKKLRRQRKKQNLQIRILEYRNETYSQSLEQIIQELLKTTDQSIVIQNAKKIVLRLAKEKAKRKKGKERKIAEIQVKEQARQIVIKWLKNNCFLEDEEDVDQFKQSFYQLNRQNYLYFNELEDQKQMNSVDIYDIFKNKAYGTQTNVEFDSKFTQSDKVSLQNAYVLTQEALVQEYGTQINLKNKNNSKISDNSFVSESHENESQIIQMKQSRRANKRSNQKKKILRSEKSIDMRQSEQKSKKKIQIKEQSIKKLKNNKKLKVDSTFSQEYKKNNSRRQISLDEYQKDYEQQQYEKKSQVSITQEDGQDFTTNKLMMLNSLTMDNQKSLAEILQEIDCPQNKQLKNHILKALKSTGKRTSLSFINNIDESQANIKELLKKKFYEVYKDQKKEMNLNKQQFFESIGRRRSFYVKKKVQFANNTEAESNKLFIKGIIGRKQFGRTQKNIQDIKYSTNASNNINKISKMMTVSSNIAKSKALNLAKTEFRDISNSIQRKKNCLPKNKLFVNNSLTSINKYIFDLINDYIKQIRKEKSGLPIECLKTYYPLNLLLLEKMTHKFGLKEIAEKKIKSFIEKILSFSKVSEKVSLFSLLLGLEDQNVGTQQLIIYLKCLIYLDSTKIIKQISIQNNYVDRQLLEENLAKVLKGSFEDIHCSILQAEILAKFNQSQSYLTIEFIAIFLIKQLLHSKEHNKERYLKNHLICQHGDNFFTNFYKYLKVLSHFMGIINSKEKYVGLCSEQNEEKQKLKPKRPKGRKKPVKSSLNGFTITKIAEIVTQLMKKSDMIDEVYGKSMSQTRFLTSSIVLKLPTSHQLDLITSYFLKLASQLDSSQNTLFKEVNPSEYRSLEKLNIKWGNSNIQKSEDKEINKWSFVKIMSDKIEEQVITVMGKLGIFSLQIESSLFMLSSQKEK